MPILHSALPWVHPRNRHLDLWHGCTTEDKNEIEHLGVDPLEGRPNTDFGRGFYTTTLERQARHWAWARYYDPKFARKTGVQPVILRFKVDRHELAKLAAPLFRDRRLRLRGFLEPGPTLPPKHAADGSASPHHQRSSGTGLRIRW